MVEEARNERAIDKLSTAVDLLTTLVTRGEERLHAHVVADDIVHEVVKESAASITILTTAVAPLTSMKKWLVTAALALLGTFSAAAFTAVNNWLAAKEAAAALPIAAKKVEDVLITPQFEREKAIKQRDSGTQQGIEYESKKSAGAHREAGNP